MVAATDLIGVLVLLFVAIVALLVLFFDALSRVLVGAVAAIARAPWRGGQLILNRLRHKTSAGSNAAGKSPVRSERHFGVPRRTGVHLRHPSVQNERQC